MEAGEENSELVSGLNLLKKEFNSFALSRLPSTRLTKKLGIFDFQVKFMENVKRSY